MAVFSRKQKPALATSLPPAEKAAAAGGGYYQSQIGQYYSYYSSTARNRAMAVPTISRARDLLASVAAGTPLRLYNEIWDPQEEEMEKVYLAPRSWLRQPDPTIPYGTLMAWTLDDLFFSGRAFWWIASRTADGFPASFTRLPASMVSTPDAGNGPIFYGPAKEVEFQGEMIDPRNVVQFISPIQGIVYQSTQCIDTAIRLENARFRNALSPIPSGILQQTSGEQLSPSELADLVSSFAAAREHGAVAGLSGGIEYHETTATPDKMMLMEAAAYQALECSRLTNVPAYLCGISTGSYAYTNSRSAREDLYIFAAKAYLDCIAGTLSSNQVLPRGTFCEFDVDSWLGEGEMSMDRSMVNENAPQNGQDISRQNTQEALA